MLAMRKPKEWLGSWLIVFYPRPWRERYTEEFLGFRRIDLVDILWNAVGARLACESRDSWYTAMAGRGIRDVDLGARVRVLDRPSDAQSERVVAPRYDRRHPGFGIRAVTRARSRC